MNIDNEGAATAAWTAHLDFPLGHTHICAPLIDAELALQRLAVRQECASGATVPVVEFSGTPLPE